jgi:hypothetical protein
LILAAVIGIVSVVLIVNPVRLFARPLPGGSARDGNRPLPLAVFDLHTSSATFERVHFFYRTFIRDDPFVANGTFVFRVIVSSSATADSPLPLSRVRCHDSINAVACRIEFSYPTFLRDFPQCAWLFRGEDDTWVNTTRFYHYLLMLNTRVSPQRHLVFRAHAMHKRKLAWVVPGGGWLMSRATVNLHVTEEIKLRKLATDDPTGESPLVRKVLGDGQEWDDWGIQGLPCQDCDSNRIAQVGLPQCTADQWAIRPRDVLALHTGGAAANMLWLISAMATAREDVLIGRHELTGQLLLCTYTARTKIWEPEQIEIPQVTADGLPRPLVDYGILASDG